MQAIVDAALKLDKEDAKLDLGILLGAGCGLNAADANDVDARPDAPTMSEEIASAEQGIGISKPVYCSTIGATAWFYDVCCGLRGMGRGQYRCTNVSGYKLWIYVQGSGYCTSLGCNQ